MMPRRLLGLAIIGIHILLLLYPIMYGHGNDNLILNLSKGDYARYTYNFYRIREAMEPEPEWVFILIEADILTPLTEDRVKYMVYPESKVYFTWRVEDIGEGGYLLELILELYNVGKYVPGEGENIVNISFTREVFVDFHGFTYHPVNGGWIEDWLFWLPGYELSNETIRLYIPLPMVGGNYVLSGSVTSNISEFLDTISNVNNDSITYWNRTVRLNIAEEGNKISVEIGDALISPYILYPPPASFSIDIMGSTFTGDRLILGGRDSLNYIDLERKGKVNMTHITKYYEKHPTHYLLPGLDEHIFLGAYGYIYASLVGLVSPTLSVYDSVTGLLLYVNDSMGVGQILPPSMVFKDNLNGATSPSYGVEMVLVDTNIDFSRPIIGGIPQEEGDMTTEQPGETDGEPTEESQPSNQTNIVEEINNRTTFETFNKTKTEEKVIDSEIIIPQRSDILRYIFEMGLKAVILSVTIVLVYILIRRFTLKNASK